MRWMSSRVPPIRSLRTAFTSTNCPAWICTTPTSLQGAEPPRPRFAAQSVRIPQHVRGGLSRTLHVRDSGPAAICESAEGRYDIVHDNQSLSYGLLGIAGAGYPTVATIHHPITVDRDTEIEAAGSWLRRLKVRRWYSFLPMQKRVSRRLSHIITVSECSRRDISREFASRAHRFRIVPNGINTDYFYPLPGVKRADNQLLVTNSADTPLKGLRYLLEAVAAIRKEREIRVVVIGEPKKNGEIERLVRELGLGDTVTLYGPDRQRGVRPLLCRGDDGGHPLAL